MTKIVLFEFAGREENLSVQWPFIERLLSTYPEMEVHLWDLTRKSSDAAYLRTLASDRVKIIDHLHTGHPIKCMYPNQRRRPRGYPPCTCMIHKPPYEKPYQWYAQHHEFQNTIFVKIDDDVLFLETQNFDHLIQPLEAHPNRIISGNIINNVVCAKYEPELMNKAANTFSVGDPAKIGNDRRWWWLHTSGAFALLSHEWFLNNWLVLKMRKASYVRPRPGEAVSINCIAFTDRTMVRLATAFQHDQRLGDEGVVDQSLPWIAQSFHVGHLTFGPQDKELKPNQINDLRYRYAQLAKEYLEA